MNRVVHFEIHADDPERAIQFYKGIFGWDFQKWENPTMQYWMIITGPQGNTPEGMKDPGINGGLVKRMGAAPKPGAPVSAYACTMQVENIDETIKKILAGGGIEALPKFAIPGMAWQAYYIDTEGNIFGVHQPDTSAK